MRTGRNIRWYPYVDLHRYIISNTIPNIIDLLRYYECVQFDGIGAFFWDWKIREGRNRTRYNTR